MIQLQENFLTEVEKIEAFFGDKIAVNRVDVYKSTGISDRLDIKEFPAVVITKDGVVYEKHIKDFTEDTLVQALNSALSAS